MPSYLILDAAQNCIPAISSLIPDFNQEKHCLYSLNQYNVYLADVAPYLFRMTAALEDYYMEHGWGKSWGIVVLAELDYDQLRFHLRKFLKVKEEVNDKQLLFRFYDPRVLNMLLPIFEPAQLKEFFGPYVQAFIAENDDGLQGKKYSLKNGALITVEFISS